MRPSHRCWVSRDCGLARFHKAVQNHELVDVGLLLLEREILQASPAELVLVELDQSKVLQELIRVPFRFFIERELIRVRNLSRGEDTPDISFF